MKKPTAILTADWHIRADTPICRTDNYLLAQNKKVLFILGLSDKLKCPILIAGDFGDKPQWSNRLLEWAIKTMGFNNILAIPGGHDLPYHRIENIKESGFGVLLAGSTIHYDENMIIYQQNKPIIRIDGIPYKQKLGEKENSQIDNLPRIAMIHEMIIDKPLWPGQDAPHGIDFLKRFPEYQLILSGDNHQSFILEHKGRKLVNPGSLMRMKIIQKDYQPRVFIWYSEDNVIEPVEIPIEKDVITDRHHRPEIDRTQNEIFVQELAKTDKIGLVFRDNLENYFREKRTRKGIEEKVWRAVDSKN